MTIRFKHFESETLGSIELAQKDLHSQIEVMSFNQHSQLVSDNRLQVVMSLLYMKVTLLGTLLFGNIVGASTRSLQANRGEG